MSLRHFSLPSGNIALRGKSPCRVPSSPNRHGRIYRHPKFLDEFSCPPDRATVGDIGNKPDPPVDDDVVGHGEILEQRVVLGDYLDAVLAGDLGSQVAVYTPADDQGAGVGFLKPAYHVGQG